MRDSIYTIPISEVFEPKKGCPICAMRDTLEQRCVEYIMGAAMMEPDIRIETNRLGFCTEHFEQMLHQKNRLSLALMLESHLKELKAHNFKPILEKAHAKPKKREGMKTVNDTCFVCEKIDWALSRMLGTVVELYGRDTAFRQLFSEQEELCLPHLELLLCAGAGLLLTAAVTWIERSVYLFRRNKKNGNNSGAGKTEYAEEGELVPYTNAGK